MQLSEVFEETFGARELHFDEAQQAWILSRYRDVLAALRSPDLFQTRPPKTGSRSGVNENPQEPATPTASSYISSELSSALLNVQKSKWQTDVRALASTVLESLPRGRPVDLAARFFRPWCLASAVALTGVDPAYTENLAQLVKILSESDAAPHDIGRKARARQANKEFDCFSPLAAGTYRKSMFLGLAQTMPYFLASAWAALLQHPSEMRALRAHPNWIPNATEELLRYAGPVHSLFRQAERESRICGARVAAGDRLVLRLRSANRDPEQFPGPNLLDARRRTAGHLALSSGPHYCPGAPLVRMITITATQALVSRDPEPELSNPVEWFWGTMVTWPSSLTVLLK